MDNGEKTNAATKQQRQRSPSYPADGLETCIRLARDIYNAEKKSVVSSVVAVKHMGYGSFKSGSARVTLSSLKKFGLLAEEGAERVRITDEAVKLFLAPEEMKLPILRSLARKPEIIREILQEYPDGLPSDENLKYRLVGERGFVEAAADTFIKSLRETVRIARLGPEEYSEPAENMPSEQNAASASQPPDPAYDPTRKPVQPTGASAPIQQRQGPSFKQHAELSDGTQVDLLVNGPLGSDVLEEVLAYVELWTKVLRKRAQSATPS